MSIISLFSLVVPSLTRYSWGGNESIYTGKVRLGDGFPSVPGGVRGALEELEGGVISCFLNKGLYIIITRVEC